MEGVVAVRPEAHLLTVDEHLSFAHGSVEEQYMSSSVKSPCIYFKIPSVGSLAYIWKTSCASCLLTGCLLPVLHDCHGLQVVRPVERAVDGPVVRNGNGFPTFDRFNVMSFSEFPFLQDGFSAGTLSDSRQRQTEHHQCQVYMFHDHSLNGSSAAVGFPSLNAPRP